MAQNQPGKLVLGTAQFGMNYGIANTKGQPDNEAVISIIQKAYQEGIIQFDTAQAYGNSEQALGSALTSLGLQDEIQIISKLKPDQDISQENGIADSLRQSLKRLSVPTLHGLMIHEEKLLDKWDSGVGNQLRSLVVSGGVSKIGISLYTVDYAIRALNTDGIDFIQIPTNILDKRFIQAGVFDIARKLNKEVYVRSVFLQGLLLMKIAEIPHQLSAVKALIRNLIEYADENGLSMLELTLAFVKTETKGAHLVVGVDSDHHLNEIVKAYNKDFDVAVVKRAQDLIPIVDERIINPSLWDLSSR
ncbi:aldo/keto reductase [bacterium]|nr:aldo/keto reductase [bacterium]